MKFAGAWSFQHGLAPVKTGGKYGFIDRRGRFVIPPRFEGAGRFEDDGVAWVQVPRPPLPSHVYIPGRPAYIDRSGRFIWGPEPEKTK